MSGLRLGAHPIVWAVAAAAAVLVAASSVAVVPETKQAVLVRLGAPVGAVNRYGADRALGRGDAGPMLHLPFVEDVVLFDKRAVDVAVQNQQLVSREGQPLVLDAFARVRVVDPVRLYRGEGSEQRAAEVLIPALGQAMRDALDGQPLARLLAPERTPALDVVRRRVDAFARGLGLAVEDVRVRRAELPTGAVRDAAFERMKADQHQQALDVAAEAERRVSQITADADADAARIYAESFDKDADFYDFYRAMQSYRTAFLSPGAATTVILSPDNDYLRQFRGGR